jgi:hypothetical protein
MGFGENVGCDRADELQTEKSRVRLEFEDLGTLLRVACKLNRYVEERSRIVGDPLSTCNAS